MAPHTLPQSSFYLAIPELYSLNYLQDSGSIIFLSFLSHASKSIELGEVIVT